MRRNRKKRMRKWTKIALWLCIAGWLGFSLPVYAHVQNEKSLYSDIEFSEAKEQIVLLYGIGAISRDGGANLYKPLELLSRSDLALWAGRFKGLQGTAEQIRQAAIDEGLVGSLEGYATYGDVNQAYFAGRAPVHDAGATLTREAFALYMGAFFTERVDGKTLFDMAGYEPGPSGVVQEVEKSTVTEGNRTYDVFRIKIGDRWYQVSHHPKIMNGPVDLTEWVDKAVEASWYAPGAEENKELDILKLGEAQFTPEEIAAIDEAGSHGDSHAHHDDEAIGENAENKANTGAAVNVGRQDHQHVHVHAHADETETEPQESGRGAPVTLMAGGAVLVAIVLWLFMRR